MAKSANSERTEPGGSSPFSKMAMFALSVGTLVYCLEWHSGLSIISFAEVKVSNLSIALVSVSTHHWVTRGYFSLVSHILNIS